MEKHRKKNRKKDAIEIVLALVVAWAAYHALAFAAGTSMPLTAIVSSSMDHEGMAFGKWWASTSGFYEDIGITKEEFAAFPYRNGLGKYDLMLVVKDEPEAGDVVIYSRVENGKIKPIIHRIIEVKGSGYVTKGDNTRTNRAVDNGGAPIQKELIVGKAVIVLPVIGFPRTLLFDIFGI